MQLKSELIEKYNISGPRYTSYPTALEFSAKFDPSNYIEALSNAGDQTLSIYLHIPFCKNICYYCACNKVITKNTEKANQYIDYLLKEMHLLANASSSKELGQIHFGGGTPTFLTNDQIKSILNKLAELFNLREDAEISLEVDPRTVDKERLVELKKLGVNRISIGVQDFTPKVQIAVNREHSYETISDLVTQARASEYQSVNMDLIYGLPHQTTENFAKTIEQVIALKPDRIALYSYAHLPHRFKPQRRINKDDLPSAEQKLVIFDNTLKLLTSAGYVYIGMDHFALPDDSLNIAQRNGELHRNFQGYTTHKDYQLIGIGVSSISKVGNCYSQNQVNLTDYYQALDNNELPVWRGCQLTNDDELRRDVIMSLICNFSLNITEIESKFEITFSKYFSNEILQLKNFIDDGLVEVVPSRITITATGRFFIRNICMTFDSYLQELSQIQSYSKVI